MVEEAILDIEHWGLDGTPFAEVCGVLNQIVQLA